MFYCVEKPRRILKIGGERVLGREVDVYENGMLIAQVVEETHFGKKCMSFLIWDNDRTRFAYGGECSSVADAKRKIKAHGYDYPNNHRDENLNVAFLPSGDASDFYPTPSSIAGKMFSKVNWSKVRCVLEPSAGKGDLADCLAYMAQKKEYSRSFALRDIKQELDVIELDYNLRLILRGKGYHLVGDDFLNFSTNKRYDVIVMNPPFSNGDEHLLKAIELMEHGGQIVCLLNAETIRNPYSKRRQVLKTQLAKYNAQIEFVKDAFKRSQRKTDVEIAIVYMNIPRPRRTSNIFENLNKAKNCTFEENENEALVGGDDIQQLIEHYNFEAKCGIALLEEYSALSPYILCSDSPDSAPIIELRIDRESCKTINSTVVDSYLRALRSKYWHIFLDRPQIREILTSAMCDDYFSKVNEMAAYEFSEHNIMQVMFDIQMQLSQGVEDSIMALFDKFSAQHSWYPECSNNIHYYSGWKTNKAHKVGNKVIIPVHGCCCDSKWDRDTLKKYTVYEIISDLERAMNFLDKGETAFRSDIGMAIDRANNAGKNKAEFTYFTATFYKKGTCHIKFKPEAYHIIDRLNIFAARQRSWLPPTYGRKSYEAMDDEERAVIDEFQGRDAYERVYNHPSDYILEGASLVALPL